MYCIFVDVIVVDNNRVSEGRLDPEEGRKTTRPWSLLGVGLLQQSAPKLPWSGRATEEQHSITADRQTVVHDNIRPTAESPEPEMEDAGVQVGTLRVPLLVHMVWDNL